MNTLSVVCGFVLCSSTLLIINKACILCFPFPSILLAAQLATSATAAGLTCRREWQWSRFVGFGSLSLAFFLCLQANMQALRFVNVETFIVARASVPVVLCWLDALFLDRVLPSFRSLLSVGATLAGAIGYVCMDSNFSYSGYTWIAMWYIIFVFDAIFIKHRVDAIDVDTNWERVAYQNIWAFLMTLPEAVVAVRRGDVRRAASGLGAADAALIASGCVVGLAMSYFSMACRKALSATSFAVVGNACKFITVFLNVLLWDKHASTAALLMLVASLVSSMFYEQAPKRICEANVDRALDDVSSEDEDEVITQIPTPSP